MAHVTTQSIEASWTPRERGKQRRRAALLAAARTSLTRGDFSMRRVAEIAGVAEVTPYNLFGSKGGLLALLYRELVTEAETGLTPRALADPLQRMLEAIDGFGLSLMTQPVLYRSLFSERINTRGGRILPQGFDDGVEFWRRLIGDMADAGQLEKEGSTDLLHRHFIHLLGGTVQDWLDDRIDAELWRAQVTHGLALLALPLALGSATLALQRVRRESAARLATATPTAGAAEPFGETPR